MHFTILPTVLLALCSVTSAIPQADFDALKNLAAVGWSYSASPQGQSNAPPCTLPQVRDFSGVIWNYIDAVNITDGAGGPITIRLFRRDDFGNQNYYLFFPGTSDGRNWATNVQVSLKDYPLCSGCQVHTGFYDAWTGGRQQVINLIVKAKNNNPATRNYNTVVGGGSLGGALSVLAYTDFKVNKPSGIDPIRGISFGQPRVGNYQFAQFVNGFVGANPSRAGVWQRVTHGWDSVPRALPLGPYQNQGTEIHMVDVFRAGNPATNRPEAGSTTVLLNVNPNNENPNGVNSPSPAGPGGNPGDHVTYPGYGSESVACVPP